MNRSGDEAELAFLLEASKRGYDIFIPFSHCTKVDIIIMKPGSQPITIQVKKGTHLKENSRPTYKVLVGSAKSSNRKPSKTPRYQRYTEGDFDILAVYLADYGFSFWRIEDVCHQSTLRWNESKTDNTNNWDLIESLFKTNKTT